MNELDPALYLRMMIVLGYPEKASLNPILLLDELQDLNVGEIYRHSNDVPLKSVHIHTHDKRENVGD